MVGWLLAACGSGPPGSAPARPPLLDRAPPTANLATYREMWLDATAPRHPSDGGGTVTATVDPDPVEVGTPVSLGITLTVGALGVAPGGVVSLVVSPFWGWTPPQLQAEGAPGYVGVTADRPVEVEAIGGLVLVTARSGLPAGSVVRFDYAGYADRFAETAPAAWIAVDGDGDGVRALVPRPVLVTTRAGPPAALIATWPSASEPGATVTLRIAAVDAVGNAFGGGGRVVSLTGGPGIAAPGSVTLDADGLAAVPVRVVAPGIHRLRADSDGIDGITGPLVARVGAEPIRWADLQIHTAASDGTGGPAEVLRYAREVAGLDVAALTDHDHWGMSFLDHDPALVAANTAATDTADQPGAFVAVHGYEWTSWVWGHRHVLGFDGPPPLCSSLDPGCDEPAELHAALAGRDAIVVRHHPAGGPVAIDWSFPLDPRLEPVVEVASVHGQSESASLPGAIYDAVPGAFVDRVVGQPGLGPTPGFVGSTDGHDGHPGLSQLAGGAGGLTALCGADLDRASVAETLRARRVYATNGPRIVLRVTVGDAPLGGVIRGTDPVDVTVRVVGTAPIDRIELVRSAGVVGSRRGDGSTALFATFPVEPLAGDVVYVRVVQVDGGLAWSSPVSFAGPEGDR